MELSKILLRKQQDKWEEGFYYCLKAVSIKPSIGHAHLLCIKWVDKFKNNLSQDQLEQKIKAYQDVIEGIEDNQINYYWQGRFFQSIGKLSEAIAYNQKAIYLKLKKSKPEFVSQHWEQGKLKEPNFLIIGVMKCGTTALYDYVIQHPKILPCITKEPNLQGLAKKREKMYENWQYYLSLFPPRPKQSNFITGEASTYNMYAPNVDRIMFDKLPQIKLIVILRNPVKRFISHYNFQLQRNMEKRSWKTVIESEFKKYTEITKPAQIIKKVTWNDYLINGLYVYFLEKWMKLFPREQFLILRNEDLSKNPSAVIKQTFEFLGLPDYQEIQFTQRNKGTYSTRIDESLLSLLKDFYRPHNQKLEEFLGRKFNWN